MTADNNRYIVFWNTVGEWMLIDLTEIERTRTWEILADTPRENWVAAALIQAWSLSKSILYDDVSAYIFETELDKHKIRQLFKLDRDAMFARIASVGIDLMGNENEH